MNREIFEEIKAYSQQVPYTSFTYSEFEDMPEAILLCSKTDLKVVLNTSGLKPVIEYATDNIRSDFLCSIRRYLKVSRDLPVLYWGEPRLLWRT